MRRLLVVPGLLALLAAALPAQTLAHSSPPDTLAYFRSWSGDPMEAAREMLSGGGLWASPVDVDQMVDMMDEGFDQFGRFLGFEAGSLGTYLRSMRGYEGALYRLVLTDGIPELDFVVVFDTPMAGEIYDLLSGKLVERAMADRVGEEELEVFVSEFSLNVGRRGDRIVLASDQRRLRETMDTFGSVVEGGLSQSKRFKAALGTDEVPRYCLYVAAPHFLQMAREEISTRARRSAPLTIMTSLGIWDIGALGWNEQKTHSRFALVGQRELPVLEILDCGKGGHQGLGTMPADTVFGVTWNGSTEQLWKKGGAFVLDGTKFPMARMVEEQLRSVQQMLGLEIAEIAALGARGFSFGFMPDAEGRLDDDPENFFAVLRTGSGEKAREVADTMITAITSRRGGEVTISDDGGNVWYRMTGPGADRDIPAMVFTGDDVVVALEESARKVLAARSGRTPNLARYEATAGLPQEASAYVFVGLRAIMGQVDEFAPAYQRMHRGAGIAAAVDVSPDSIVVRTTRPVTHVFGAFGMAASLWERHREVRRAIKKDLTRIAKAYREYRAAQGKDPTSLAQLGLTGDDAPRFPPNRPEGTPGRPYKLVSTDGADLGDEADVVVVICPDPTYGRLVGTLEGTARGWSEERFQRAFRHQRFPK